MGLLLSVVSCVFRPILRIFNAKHEVNVASPDRHPPNPKFFPRYMQNAQGLWLYWREWKPDGPPKGIVFLVGGLAEHSGRYDSIAARWNDEGFIAFSLDHQGQGASEGTRRYFEKFSHLVDDLEQFIQQRIASHPSFATLPKFVLGHSMGGLISIAYMYRHPSFINGAIISAPALVPAVKVSPLLRNLNKYISPIAPKLPVESLHLIVSRNPQVQDLYATDPMLFKAPVQSRWAAELFAAQDEVLRLASTRGSFPFLLLHGTADNICDIAGSERMMQDAPSKDKYFKVYPNAMHEFFTDEGCCEEVYRDIFAFVQQYKVRGHHY